MSLLGEIKTETLKGLSDTNRAILTLLDEHEPHAVTNYTIARPELGGMSHTARISEIRRWMRENSLDLKIVNFNPRDPNRKGLRLYWLARSCELDLIGHREIRGDF